MPIIYFSLAGGEFSFVGHFSRHFSFTIKFGLQLTYDVLSNLFVPMVINLGKKKFWFALWIKFTI